MSNIFAERIYCWQDTLRISNRLLSFPPPSLKMKYNKDFDYVKKYEKSNIAFLDMDAIDFCLEYSPNALILNLADDKFPGGAVATGSGAQEESLFRRTNYCNTLDIQLYPLKRDEAIYSRGVSVLKTNEKTGWKLLDINNLPKVSFVACPGLKHPTTIVIEEEHRLNPEDVEILKIKITTIIQTAIQFNHDTIILGALGCGAWRNPRKHVAEVFKEVLDTYDGCVLNYYFAILTTKIHNPHNENNKDNLRKTIDIFREVFSK